MVLNCDILSRLGRPELHYTSAIMSPDIRSMFCPLGGFFKDFCEARSHKLIVEKSFL
jgi:hypothetical protein